MKIIQSLFQKLGCAAGSLCTLYKVLEIKSILFFGHRIKLFLSLTKLKDIHKNLVHDEADQATAWKSEYPCEHLVFYNIKIDGGQTFHRTHTHDSTGLRVGSGYGDSKNAEVEQTQSAVKVGRESLIFFKFYHIHADRLDDFFSSHAGAGSHHKTAEQH